MCDRWPIAGQLKELELMSALQYSLRLSCGLPRCYTRAAPWYTVLLRGVLCLCPTAHPGKPHLEGTLLERYVLLAGGGGE